MATTTPDYTQAQITAALQSCCSSPDTLSAGCEHVASEFPGCPCDMIATAAFTLFPTITPESMVQQLAAAGTYPAPDVAAAIMKTYPTTPMSDLGQAIGQGYTAAGAPLTQLGWAQAITQGFTEARAGGAQFTPPLPTLSNAAAPNWVLPIGDPDPNKPSIQMATGAQGEVLVVATGTWLTFRDPATGAIQALADGGFGASVRVAGDTVYAFDWGRNQVCTFALDGTPGWSTALPPGYIAVGDTCVFHQSVADGTVTALDRAAGSQAWQVNHLNASTNYPGIAAGSGLVVYKKDAGTTGLDALSQADGSLAWQWTEETAAWGGTDDLLIADSTVFVPSQNHVWYLPAATGSGATIAWALGTNHSFEWAVFPARSLVVSGWDWGKGCFQGYRDSRMPSMFPSGSVASGPPDPTKSRVWPVVKDGDWALMVYAASEVTQVYEVEVGWLAPGVDAPGTLAFTVPGVPYAPTVDGGSLYMVLQEDGPDGWLVSLPLS